MNDEPCMCGDPECPRCYPAGYVEQEYDEDSHDERLCDRAVEDKWFAEN